MAVHQDLQARGRAGPPLPEQLPEDLRWRLLDALSYDSCTPQDVWDTLRDWMIANGMAREGAARINAGPRGCTRSPQADRRR